MHIVQVATVYEPNVEALPPEFRSVLTEQDVAGILHGPEYFATLANADSPKWLRDVLQQCGATVYELQFLSSGGAPYRPYFRFPFLGSAISLPRTAPLRRDVPAFLHRLYGVIGAFCETGFDMAGGLHPGDELKPLSEIGIWVESGGTIDPSTAIPFLETLAGSQLCYRPDGGGAWLESGQFRPVKDLEREVARYFKALLEGSRI